MRSKLILVAAAVLSLLLVVWVTVAQGQTDSYRGRIPLKPSTGEPNHVANKAYQNLDHVIDVRDYGATGDGVTDDTAALVAAIAACPAGGTVFVPPGTHLFDGPINLNGYKNLLGTDPEFSILKNTDTAANGICWTGSGWIRNVQILGMGNAAGTGHGLVIGKNAAGNFANTAYLYADNIWVVGHPGCGISYVQGWKVAIEHSMIGLDGATLSNGVHDLEINSTGGGGISQFYFTENWFASDDLSDVHIHLTGSWPGTFRDCSVAYKNTLNGIEISGGQCLALKFDRMHFELVNYPFKIFHYVHASVFEHCNMVNCAGTDLFDPAGYDAAVHNGVVGVGGTAGTGWMGLRSYADYDLSRWVALKEGQVVYSNAPTNSLTLQTKTKIVTIDLDDDASTDDYQFDDDAANMTEQVITLTNILPARATLMDWQIYCIEGAADANTVTVDFGTTSGGSELGTGAPDDLDEMISMAAGAAPALAPTNAARSLYVGATPSVNWAVMHSLWRIEVVISYIDNLAAHIQKNP